MVTEILELISQTLGIELDISDADKNLVTDIGLTSFEIIQLVAATEQKYGIRIPTRKLAGFTTPKSIAEYIAGEIK